MANLQELTTSEEWQSFLNESSKQPIVLFKHSTTCPISANAWREFQSSLEDLEAKGIKTAYVKVIESRPVSNQIAEDLGVTHQSPQLILIKDKKSEWKTSHWDITKNNILKEVNA